MEEILISDSDIQTREIAARLISTLDSGTTICLYGDLAAGKTTFAQGIAYALGIKRLTSPTFIIMREYPVTSSVFSRLFHLDLYRLHSPEEIKAFDLDEITSDTKNLVLIEWPDRIEKILPKKRIDIYFQEIGDNKREIKIIRK